MKTDFAKPRFTGARFDEHTLPVEVAQDLVAYETLIVELAKYLYLQDNLNRQRVPKGFAADFHLDIVRIEEGSTQLALATVALSSALSVGTADLVGGEQIYFEKARELYIGVRCRAGKRIARQFSQRTIGSLQSSWPLFALR